MLQQSITQSLTVRSRTSKLCNPFRSTSITYSSYPLLVSRDGPRSELVPGGQGGRSSYHGPPLGRRRRRSTARLVFESKGASKTKGINYTIGPLPPHIYLISPHLLGLATSRDVGGLFFDFLHFYGRRSLPPQLPLAQIVEGPLFLSLPPLPSAGDGPGHRGGGRTNRGVPRRRRRAGDVGREPYRRLRGLLRHQVFHFLPTAAAPSSVLPLGKWLRGGRRAENDLVTDNLFF